MRSNRTEFDTVLLFDRNRVLSLILWGRISLFFGVESFHKLVLNIRYLRHIRLIHGNGSSTLDLCLILNSSLVQFSHELLCELVVLLREVRNAVLVAEFRILYSLVFGLAEGLITSENCIAELFVEILCDRQSILRIVAGLRLIGRH